VSRLGILVAAVAVAAIIVVAAILLSAGGADDPEPATPSRSDTPEQARDVLEGLPQDGVSLGDPDAPATLIEFADLQCPFCAEFANNELPGVIDEYVRSGDLRLELRLLAFIGPDSARARQVANAATLQNKLWNYAELFFANQGAENSGYATNSFLERLARQTPGLDVEQLTGDFGSQEVDALSREAERMARRLGVEGTPAFYLVRDGGEPEQIEIDSLGEALGGG
jgi:protein-disulfide isomerase